MIKNNEPRLLVEPQICTECGIVHTINHNHQTCGRQKEMLPLRIWGVYCSWRNSLDQETDGSASVLQALLDVFEASEGIDPLSLEIVNGSIAQLHLPGLQTEFRFSLAPSEVPVAEFRRLPERLQEKIIVTLLQPKPLATLSTTGVAPTCNHHFRF